VTVAQDVPDTQTFETERGSHIAPVVTSGAQL
jgi:hypothetical protein